MIHTITNITDFFYNKGRRGLCGTMFVFKIVGAMAERGVSLEDITKTAR